MPTKPSHGYLTKPRCVEGAIRWERSLTTLLRNGCEAVAEFKDWRECEVVRRKLAVFDDTLAALKEAIEFQNEDTECLANSKYLEKGEGEVCDDGRCCAHGCMVARVNRWRAVAGKAEGQIP